MRFYDITFFVDTVNEIACHISENTSTCWNDTLILNFDSENSFEHPQIILFLKDEQAVINFKNAVISAFETYERNKHAA